jgi:pimeloyl-ACP methyl ester carboxylesterase
MLGAALFNKVLSKVPFPGRMFLVKRKIYPKVISSATSVLLLLALVWLACAVPATRAVFGKDPLLFVSERADLHLHPNRAHSSFLKVVQGSKYKYGMRTEDGDALFSADEFYRHIDERRKKAPKAPIILFVHGCCVSFGEQLLQANDLEKEIDRSYARSPGNDGGQPITLSYDWAAPFVYGQSLENCFAAQPRFDSFMHDLVARYGADSIIVVGHSLGTLMVETYVAQITDQDKQAPFQAIIFSRADIDRQTFSDCLPALKSHSKRLIVLASSNDPNIYASALLRRLGVKFAQAAVLPTRMSLQISKRIAASPLPPPSSSGAASASSAASGQASASSKAPAPASASSVAQTPASSSSTSASSSDNSASSIGEEPSSSAPSSSDSSTTTTTTTTSSSSSSSPAPAEAPGHAKTDEDELAVAATALENSTKYSRKVRTRRLGQVKAAREFAQVVEVYDLSSFRIGHGIPYRFIGDILFNAREDFDIKKDVNGVVTVHSARP